MMNDKMVEHPPNPRAVDRGKWYPHKFGLGDVVVLYSHADEDGKDVLPNMYWDHTRWGGKQHSNYSYIVEERETVPHKVVGYAIIIKEHTGFWHTIKRIGGARPISDKSGRVHDYDADLFSDIDFWYIANMEVALDERTRLPMFVADEDIGVIKE